MDETLKQALEALKSCVVSLERADTKEGVCCCGDNMETHDNPMNCGHSPVDMGEYHASNAISAANAAIAAIEQHKPVVRMLTDEELAECCGRAVPNSAAMTWMRRSIRKFAEKNGLTIGEHG